MSLDICTRVEGATAFRGNFKSTPKPLVGFMSAWSVLAKKGGLLAEILARLAVYLENAARLRKKVKSAMMYPTVVTIVAILITTFLLIKSRPGLRRILKVFNSALPAPTRTWYLSQFVQHYILLIMVAGGAAFTHGSILIKHDGPQILGHLSHRLADFRRHCPQDLPRSIHSDASLSGPQRCSHFGSVADCFPNRR